MLLTLSPYLFAAITAWLVAQGSKYLIASVKQRRWLTPGLLYLSGDMPSAHSATVVALLVVIGAFDGVNSGLFGLAAAMTAIVLYDAMMVRRSSGEQGAALTALIKERGSKVKLPRVAKGHTPLEVVVGALVGVVVGLTIVFLISLK